MNGRLHVAARSLWLNVALGAAIVLFAIGLFAPLFTVEKLMIFADTVSIVSSLLQLAREGYPLLFALLLVFSVLLPLCKLAVLVRVQWFRIASTARWLQWVDQLAKWSMLDVYVVAVLVISIKLDYIANVRIRFGLYAFAASVLLSMFIAASLRQRESSARHDGQHGTPGEIE